MDRCKWKKFLGCTYFIVFERDVCWEKLPRCVEEAEEEFKSMAFVQGYACSPNPGVGSRKALFFCRLFYVIGGHRKINS